MSFRGRLRLFFVLIVILPMIALAIVLFVLTTRSETGKADAGIAAGMRTAFAVHDAQARQTADEARRVAGDPELRAALVEERLPAARGRIRGLIGGKIEAIEIRSPSRELLARAGSSSAVAPRGTTVERADGHGARPARRDGARRQAGRGCLRGRVRPSADARHVDLRRL